jgi:hypothetical protein
MRFAIAHDCVSPEPAAYLPPRMRLHHHQDAVRLQTPLLVGGVGAGAAPALRARLLQQLRRQAAQAAGRGHPIAGWILDLPPGDSKTLSAQETADGSYEQPEGRRRSKDDEASHQRFWQGAEFRRCLHDRHAAALDATRAAAAAAGGIGGGGELEGRWGPDEAGAIRGASAEAGAGFLLTGDGSLVS